MKISPHFKFLSIFLLVGIALTNAYQVRAILTIPFIADTTNGYAHKVISVALDHSNAVKPNGTVWTWGQRFRIGDGSTA